MQNKTARSTRVRSKIKAVSNRPRLSVVRSNKNIWAQIISDQTGQTLVSAGSKTIDSKDAKGTKTAIAAQVGTAIAAAAKAKKITTVVFDRGAYRFHGRIKALAEAARVGGLKF